jgi:hypothetical protein
LIVISTQPPFEQPYLSSETLMVSPLEVDAEADPLGCASSPTDAHNAASNKAAAARSGRRIFIE